ncbi:MAG: hypothetical protein EKK48_11995 [Candidatus Melainabacteria bacterium]|nr:MAG: hypothetical protein EKK48_11995 [Candidatus Melainabacteria bacterium]
MVDNTRAYSTFQRRIFLFDVDGVIVNPIAYRLGITRTLTELCKKIGLTDIPSILPTEAEVSAMESQGVHDVWDMTNIMFCDILTTIAVQSYVTQDHLPARDVSGRLAGSKVQNSDEIDEVLSLFSSVHTSTMRPDYMTLAKEMAVNDTHSHPPDIALQLFSQKLLPVNQSSYWLELLKRFLIGTRSVYSSLGTRLFQNIILGSSNFERTYELKSACEGAGLLETEDKTLISKETVDKLKELSRDAANSVGVYTARPSLPPTHAKVSSVGYSPEAEIALDNAGMRSFPLIAMGMMEWLAKEHGQRTEDLTKPNSTQAVAALINTITQGQDVLALHEAYAIDKQEKDPGTTSLSTIKEADTVIYVFEDTISGIVPLLKTTELLQSRGFNIKLEPLGIANEQSKRIALEQYCQQVFSNVNDAFASINPCQ